MGKKKGGSSMDFTGLEKDLRRYANNVCRYAASEIADEMTEKALLSIAAFYSDYSPSKYQRHYYNFMNNSFRRYYSNPHNKIYRGGIELTPDAMDAIYQHPIDEVYGSVIESGSHGPELYTTVPPMKKSPLQMMYEDRDEIEKNINTYINRAKLKAKNDSYSVLSFK